jgi:hypothetical protein
VERLQKQKNYISQIDFSKIRIGDGAYYLVRGVSSKNIKDEYGRLKSEFVAKQTSHIRDYSTNLLGKTLPSDLIEQIKCEWYFFLKFDDFNGTTITDKVVSKVLHTPLEENYWHCSLRWYINGKDSEELTKSQSRQVWEQARSYIITMAIFEEPSFEEIPEDLYTSKCSF